MAEYIEREAAIDFIQENQCKKCSDIGLCGGCAVLTAIKLFQTVPAADVAPVRHGEWFVSIGKDGKPVGTICPVCGFAWAEAIDAVKLEPCLSLIETAYCPNCGAKMGEET